MKKPAFSFVVPVYNSEKWLKRCLDSVFAQTCDDYEVIVVDDCSPGNCKEIVDSYGEKIRYVRHDKNRSLLQARITGGKLAKGEYLVSLDSDDYVGSELIAELKREALANHSDVIVYHMGIETSGKVVPAWHNHSKDMISSGEMLRKLYAHEVFWPMCGKAVLREVYIKAIQWTGIDDELYINSTEDLGNMVSVLINSSTVSFIEYLGYFYWQNPDSMTKDIGCFSRILPRATQNKLCIDMLLTAAEKHRCVNMVNVKELASPSIRWFVEEIAHLSPAEWSRCVNMLCGIYGCDIVLEVAKKYCRDFFERYIPDKSLFFHEQRVTVRNLAVICFRRNGGGAERATGIWMQKVKKLGIKCIWMPDRTWEKDSEFALDEDPVKREAELERYIKSEKIDAVLLVDHWRYTCFQDLLTAKRLGCKTIIAEHSTYFFPLDDLNPSLFLAREHFYPIADVITVLSPENVAWWNARGLKNVVYMPNFLTFEKHSSLKKWHDKSYEILCVGRICKRKGAELILEALSVFLQNHKDLEGKVKLTFLGRFEDDEMQERMKTMRHRLSLNECVDFAGNVDNVSDYYERADLLVIASRLEGAPMILWEAKAYGMPVVMFDLPYVTGTKETEGVVTVPMGDTFAMGEAIYACLTDQEKYERLSYYAVSALNGFDEKTILQRWRSVIDGLQKGVVPTELNPLCDRTRMLDISMESVSSLARVLCDEKKGIEKRINAQIGVVRAECDNVWRKLNEAWQKHDAVCKERDEVWRKLNEAWKMHDVIRNERNEAWEKLDAALKRSGVPDDYIDLQRKLRDMQAEEVRHKMEIEALKARIAAAERGAGIKDDCPERRFVWKNGDWLRGFTWPFRMAKSFCRSVAADGFSETKRRVVRKIVILFERFFPG